MSLTLARVCVPLWNLFVSYWHHIIGTFYEVIGVGACGWSNNDSQYVVALGHQLFDSGDFCGRTLTATCKAYRCPLYRIRIWHDLHTDKGKSVTVEVVDRCAGCAEYDLDFSPAAFDQLADPSVGRIYGVTWHFNAQWMKKCYKELKALLHRLLPQALNSSMCTLSWYTLWLYALYVRLGLSSCSWRGWEVCSEDKTKLRLLWRKYHCVWK